MFEPTAIETHAGSDRTWSPSSGTGSPGLEAILARMPMQRRRVHSKQSLFRAGQPRQSLFYVHAGCFKTCLVSEDGREKITGFRMRGDLLGLDALDMTTYACDAVALDVGEVWELPYAQLRDASPEFRDSITAMLAGEIRRDWNWMLALGTLGANQRVVTFLLDLSGRLAAMGFSPRQLMLRMTRAELGNFLALKLETVTRALSRLQAQGLIGVDGRQISIVDAPGFHPLLQEGGRVH
jgi:CRP/FNR family transcriptional regulator, anaerobic regulatory protein